MDTAAAAVKVALQQPGAPLSAGDNGIREVGNAQFEQPGPTVPSTLGVQKVMGHHFAGHAPLKVGHQRHALEPAQAVTNERPLVQVTMNDVKAAA